MKHIYVVLGMPRSGTSAITRGLKALGIDLGEKLTPAHHRFNPKGFWEDKEIVYKINHQVSQLMQVTELCGMSDVLPATDAVQKLKEAAIHLLTERMHHTQYWGFKDPSTSRIVPFWREVFQAMQMEDQYIIALRHPLAAAHSVQKHTRIDLETGLLMWLMHMIPAIDATVDKNRIIISYELMLQHPTLQLDRIRNSLVFPLVPDAREVEQYTQEFLDNSLRHFVFSDEDLITHPAAKNIPLCAEVYTLLLKLARDEILFQSDEFKQAWSEIKIRFAQAYPSYQYIANLLARNKTLEKELKTLRKSLPWKLIYPLRLIDDVLRYYRRHLRQRKKLTADYAR